MANGMQASGCKPDEEYDMMPDPVRFVFEKHLAVHNVQLAALRKASVSAPAGVHE